MRLGEPSTPLGVRKVLKENMMHIRDIMTLGFGLFLSGTLVEPSFCGRLATANINTVNAVSRLAAVHSFVLNGADLYSLPSRLGQQRTDTTVKLAVAPRHAGIATLVAELTIGEVDGLPQYLLADVKDVLSAQDGTIWILDGDRFLPTKSMLRQYNAIG